MKEKLKRAIQLIKKGDKESARTLLREIVDANPDQIIAWFWLADAYSTDSDRISILKEAADHHPEDTRLKSALEKLSPVDPLQQEEEELVPETSDTDLIEDEEPEIVEDDLPQEFAFIFDEDDDEAGGADRDGDTSITSGKKTKKLHSFTFGILLVLLLGSLGAAWLFRDSLHSILFPADPSAVSVGITLTVEGTEPDPSDTPELTMTSASVLEATERPEPTLTAIIAGSSGGTPTPILMTTPTNTAVVEEGKFIVVRGSKINDMAWSADGEYFAVAGEQGVTIYNGETFTEKIHIALDPVVAVKAIAFSSDGSFIAAGFDQSNSGEDLITRAKMWKVNDGAEVMSFDYNEARGDIDTLAFSLDDGTLYLNAQLDMVLKWRTNDGALLNAFPLSASAVDYFDVVFAPDRLSFATYSRFDRVRLYDTVSGEQITVLGESKEIQDVAFSANSQYLAVQFEEQPVVYMWDLPAREKIREWNTFSGNVTTMAFDADNQTLAVGTDEDLIKFYQIRTGEEQRVISRQIPSVEQMVFAPDDILFAVRNQTDIQIWHLLTDTLVATFRVTD